MYNNSNSSISFRKEKYKYFRNDKNYYFTSLLMVRQTGKSQKKFDKPSQKIREKLYRPQNVGKYL